MDRGFVSFVGLMVVALSLASSARGDYVAPLTPAEAKYGQVLRSFRRFGDLHLVRGPHWPAADSQVREVVVRIRKVLPPGIRKPEHYSKAAPLTAGAVTVEPAGLFAQLEKILEESPHAGRWPGKPLREYVRTQEFELTESECPQIRRVVDSFHDLDTEVSIWGEPPTREPNFSRNEVSYSIRAKGPAAGIEMGVVSGHALATWAEASIASIVSCTDNR